MKDEASSISDEHIRNGHAILKTSDARYDQQVSIIKKAAAAHEALHKHTLLMFLRALLLSQAHLGPRSCPGYQLWPPPPMHRPRSPGEPYVIKLLFAPTKLICARALWLL